MLRGLQRVKAAEYREHAQQTINTPIAHNQVFNLAVASSSGRTNGIQCLGPALRSERLPVDFKGPHKVVNYIAGMEPAEWIESYEMGMKILDVIDTVCARYLSMMLEGAAKTW